MSDAESEEDTSFIFYKDREEWKNVTPIPQDDGPDPVVKINYSKKCKYGCLVSDTSSIIPAPKINFNVECALFCSH